MIGPAALAPLVDAVLRHTLDGDLDQAAAVLDQVTEHGDDADMYGLCIAAAESGVSTLPDVPGPWTQTLTDTGDPHRLFAAQFLVAYLDDNRAMTTHLFHAVSLAGARARTESVCALLALVCGLNRRTTTAVPEGI